MAHDGGRPLPKFGEWDVNNPASADGFTVIFAKARDEKIAGSAGQAQRNNHTPQQARSFQGTPTTPNTKWFCCF